MEAPQAPVLETRRERRERERVLEAASAAAAGPAPDDLPGLVAEEALEAAPEPVDGRTAPPREPDASTPAFGVRRVGAMPPLRRPRAHRAPRPRRRARRVIVLTSMLFAGAMTFATTVPANAVQLDAETAQGVDATRVGAAAGTAALTAAGQHLHSEGKAERVMPSEDFLVLSREEVAARANMNRADTFTNDPNGAIQWPFPFGVPISDGFGYRVQPTAGASTYHEGVDFDPGYGTPIHVVADGTVRLVEPLDNSGYGVHVIVDHHIDGRLVSSVYGHMQPGSIRVSQGQEVSVGDVIGLVGNTGVSTGPHLHFEIRLDGTRAVDPYAWLKAHAD